MAVHHKNYWYYKGIALRRLHGAGHPDGRRKDEESIACFDKALTENSEHYLTWREKGQALYMLGRYEEAIPCFDEAIRLDKDNRIVYAENKALVIKEQEEDNV